MKTVGWIFVAMALGFLAMVLFFAGKFLLGSHLGLEAKLLACFVALLALGTTIGRIVHVFKDTQKNK